MQFWAGTAFMPTTDLIGLARVLDVAGYDGLMVSDHLVYPRELRTPYPYSTRLDGAPMWTPETAWPDAWVTIGALAAVTERLRFATNVYIAPMRPLLEVAKQVATAAVLSNGRVALGLAAGWMREEFELLGADFATRGRRLDEIIDALRALWRGGWVSWTGEHYEIPELMLEPHPPTPIPILCGGISDAALRRAARSCDGWIGTAFGWDDAAAITATLRRLLAEFGRADARFQIVVALTEPPSAALYRRAEEELGITGVMCAPWMHSAETPRDAIARFADEIIAPTGDR